jgi:4-hydroxy-tetrahydrodipicolinate synthase
MEVDVRKFFTTVVCPFDDDGAIDEASYRRILKYFMEPRFRDLGGICVNAEAGEVFYLSRAEKRRLVEIALEETNGKMPVFAGSFGITTADVVDVAKDAKAVGAAGLFAIPPPAAETSRRTGMPTNIRKSGSTNYWRKCAVDMPIITHPSGSSVTPLFGKGIPARATEAICKQVPNVVGWKMTYPYEGNKKITQILRALDRPIAVLQSGGYYFHEHLAAGNFDGTMSGFWNVSLEPMLDHVEAWKSEDVATARKIWNGGLSELQNYIKGDGRMHIRYKIGAWLRGHIDRPQGRPPMPAPRPEEIETMHRLMSKLGLSVIDKKEVEQCARAE